LRLVESVRNLTQQAKYRSYPRSVSWHPPILHLVCHRCVASNSPNNLMVFIGTCLRVDREHSFAEEGRFQFSILNIHKCKKLHCVPPTENESSPKQPTAREIDGLTPSSSKLIEGTKPEPFQSNVKPHNLPVYTHFNTVSRDVSRPNLKPLLLIQSNSYRLLVELICSKTNEGGCHCIIKT